MIYMLTICQLTLATIFGWSVFKKWQHLHLIALALHQSQIHPQWVRFITLSLLPIESSLATLLVVASPATLPSTMIISTLLLVLFTGWQGWVLGNKFHIACGCFGSSAIVVNKWNVLRNIVLLGIACTGFVLSLITTSLILVAPFWLITTCLLVVVSGTGLKIMRY
jgi:hypothetical protein